MGKGSLILDDYFLRMQSKKKNAMDDLFEMMLQKKKQKDTKKRRE